jgi:hypothetical protein
VEGGRRGGICADNQNGRERPGANQLVQEVLVLQIYTFKGYSALIEKEWKEWEMPKNSIA